MKSAKNENSREKEFANISWGWESYDDMMKRVKEEDRKKRERKAAAKKKAAKTK